MFHIGIGDDDARSRALLLQHLERYRREHPHGLAISTYTDGWDLVHAYRADLDVLFLDVEMPRVGGYDAAHRIREIDQRVSIVFVTRLAQLAIRGYEVGALSYLVKPVPYAGFAREVSRALSRASRDPADHLLLPTARGTARVDVSDVVSVESRRHRITAHTLDTEYAFTGTLRAVEERVADRGFFRTSSSSLVNLRHVLAVQQAGCVVRGDREVPISRAKRRPFLDALTDYLGGRVP